MFSYGTNRRTNRILRIFLYLWLIIHFSIPVLSNPLVLLEEGFHHDIDDNIVTVGDDYGCVIERIEEVDIGGEIICWGNGKYHELDPPPGIFIQISAAGHTTCAISIEGNLVCWGNTPLVTQYTKLLNENDKPYLQVSVGTDSLCVLSHSGSIQCTGKCSILHSLSICTYPNLHTIAHGSCNGKTNISIYG